MWFIGVEVEQEKSAPPPKKILDPPLFIITGVRYTKVPTYKNNTKYWETVTAFNFKSF